MDFSITPWKGDSLFAPWPFLADRAFCLTGGSRAGETVFFFDSGAGAASAPVVVLVHGLGDEADSFRHVIPLLRARGYRVLAPDLPGFGRSIARGGISVNGHAGAVLRFVEVVAPETPVFLAGNSLGAVVAELVTLKKPRLVRGLVLLDGSFPGGPASPGFFALAKTLFSKKWYRAYRENPEKAWVSLFPYYADLDSLPREDKIFLRARVMARVKSPAQEKAYFATQRSLILTFAVSSSRFSRGIKQYGGNILLVWGEKDRIIPLSSAEKFRALRNDIRLETIAGAGHLPHQEKPDETARLIAEFVEKNRN